MIWDTGAHKTIITEDVLSAEFQEYLKDPVHDPYRSVDGLCVRIEANVLLTNSVVPIAAVALNCPESNSSKLPGWDIVWTDAMHRSDCIPQHSSLHSSSKRRKVQR